MAATVHQQPVASILPRWVLTAGHKIVVVGVEVEVLLLDVRLLTLRTMNRRSQLSVMIMTKKRSATRNRRVTPNKGTNRLLNLAEITTMSQKAVEVQLRTIQANSSSNNNSMPVRRKHISQWHNMFPTHFRRHCHMHQLRFRNNPYPCHRHNSYHRRRLLRFELPSKSLNP
jgi:hypothetical protein